MGLRGADLYAWVKEARRGLLAYCRGLPPEAFVKIVPGIGWGSIRNTMVHVADAYRHWLLDVPSEKESEAFRATEYPDVEAVVGLMDLADAIAAGFLERFGGEAFGEALRLRVSFQAAPFLVTPGWLLAHAVTHEFHHKGQIVTAGRLLGHPAPDTDMAWPS